MRSKMGNKWLRKLRRGSLLLSELLKYETAGLCVAVLKCVNREYRQVWLVSERGREARDNGYHFFAYLSKEHPEINAWYVADPSLPDYERVGSLGKVVPYRSWKHYLLCAASQMKVSTHILGYTPEIDSYYMLDKLHVVRGPRAFLQHGIIVDDMKWYHYPNVRTDLFVCTLQKERDFVESRFGYPPGVVQSLGLCRLDALLLPHEIKKQLLIMPTWRTYAVENKSREEFEQSQYYQCWQAFIDSPELEDILEKYDSQAVFYPHFEVQRFLTSFHTKNVRVKLGALGKADVQTLLKESAALITDFSSVHFDFAYMKKPLLYYQFDEKAYWGVHHDVGFFDYRKDGFGPVVTEPAELLVQTQRMLARDGCMEPDYAKRVDATFDTIDDQNCARNYQAIKALLENA